VIHEKVHHAPRITVWVAISSHGLLGPIFFEKTVNSERYLSMLCSTLVPYLLAGGLVLQTHWFMQDRARPHTAKVVLDLLHDTFGSSVISYLLPDRFICGQKWPLNSLDLISCDCFLRGFLTEEIFLKKPQTVMELRALIIQACNEIAEDMCRRVINTITVCIEEVARCNGGHTENLIHR
jgi:hypothetical protein